jgi:YfiH family protein
LASLLQVQTQTFRVQQVHGNQVLSTAEVQAYWQQLHFQLSSLDDNTVDTGSKYPQADGLFSQDKNQGVWVCTADCTPVLIADIGSGQVAAVHAGWRGTAAKIVPIALNRLQEQGSQLSDIRVVMGPAIAGTHYQVTTEVAAQVGSTVLDPEFSSASAEEITAYLLQVENAPLLVDPEPGRVRLDVRQVNAMQLGQMGLLPEQIAIAPYCTYQSPEQFFSYRREKCKQVQWSGIVSC